MTCEQQWQHRTMQSAYHRLPMAQHEPYRMDYARVDVTRRRRPSFFIVAAGVGVVSGGYVRVTAGLCVVAEAGVSGLRLRELFVDPLTGFGGKLLLRIEGSGGGGMSHQRPEQGDGAPVPPAR